MIISRSIEETIAAGRARALEMRAGEVLALVGELGAGKTQFVKGLAIGLEITAAITSPTFTIIHEYFGGRIPLYHFDFYRMQDASAALALGLDDYFYGDGISVVEWADRFPQIFPTTTRWLQFKMKSANDREICEIDKP